MFLQPCCQEYPEAYTHLVNDFFPLSGTQYTILRSALKVALWALQGAGEELGLDISQADALTLRQLQHYVQSCFGAGEGAVSWPDCLVGSGESRVLMLGGVARALCMDHYQWPDYHAGSRNAF